MNHFLTFVAAILINTLSSYHWQNFQDIQLRILALPTSGHVLGESLKDNSDLLKYVDKKNSIGADSPDNLVSLSELGYPAQMVRTDVYPDLKRLMDDARALGLDMRIVSAFRSYDTQQELFNSYAKRYGPSQANRFSALPGHSEHQLGTAVDFGNGRSTDLSDSFFYQPEGQWLYKNAHKYGFVLSYPNDKQAYTGYIFEPWHFRYVGVENAKLLYESGLTINEFVDTQATRLEAWLESAQLVVGLDESLPGSQPNRP